MKTIPDIDQPPSHGGFSFIGVNVIKNISSYGRPLKYISSVDIERTNF
jgi:hypothetical protein